jgi:predicted nuclease of predicted toxin-antitoxin system
MKFLANENFPHPSIQLLKSLGYDVVSVNNDRPSITGEEVVKWANAEGRVILTFDRDYGEIVFRYKIACPVVFLEIKVIALQVQEKYFYNL